MAYTARELITRAYYLSQIVSRQLQTPSGQQITDGLYLLNSLLDFMSTDIRLIPYFRRYEFDSVVGQEEYFVSGLLYVDSLTFNIGDVRYSINEATRKQYFAGPRVDGIQSLPYVYRTERELDGMRIFLYFEPQAIYQMKLSGKFRLGNVTLDTDMSLTYDEYYIEWLRYALAVKVCEEWGSSVPDTTMAKYKEMQKKLMEVSPPDLSIQKNTYFNSLPGFDWQMINLYKGWVPY